MKAALLQITSSDDPSQNARDVAALAREAAETADIIFTPEVTNCVSLSRRHQQEVLRDEGDDETLAMLREVARETGTFIHIGSLALLGGAEDRFLNRGFVIDRGGDVTLRYDKIHMFDVAISAEETFKESAAFAPGDCAALTDLGEAKLGTTICYDLRFAHLFRRLAKAGADIIAVPAAFSPETGRAHWETLLRARAIETGCYIVAAAQTGTHEGGGEKKRKTWGHSMVVDSWGKIVAQLGDEPSVLQIDLDLSLVTKSRARVPSLTHDRAFEGP